MSHKLPVEYVHQVAGLIDLACDFCQAAPNAKAGSSQRIIVLETIDALGRQVEAQGHQGRRLARQLKLECDKCLAGGRQMAILEARFSCGIRHQSWIKKDAA